MSHSKIAMAPANSRTNSQSFNSRAPVTLEYLEKGKLMYGKVTNFHAEYNLVVFKPDLKMNLGGSFPHKELGFMVPGSDFFRLTPKYFEGLEFVFTKIKPIISASIVIESQGYRDGIPVCFMEFADPKYQTPNCRLDEIFQTAWGELSTVEFEKGKTYTGFVSSIDKKGVLSLSLDDSIIKIINEYLGKFNLADLIKAAGTLKAWEAKKLYLAKSNLDDQGLYRAVIKEECKDKNEVFVYFIDYGNSEWVSKNEVVLAEFACIGLNFVPPQCVQAYPVGVPPVTPEALDKYKEILYEKDLKFEVGATMHAVVDDESGESTKYPLVRVVYGQELLNNKLKILM